MTDLTTRPEPGAAKPAGPPSRPSGRPRPAGHGLLRHRRASFLVHRRSAAVAGVLLLLLAAAFVTALCVGETYVSPLDALRSVFGVPNDNDFVVGTLRLPRVVTGVLVGLAFGAAGSLIQTVARNPLASPDVIGITRGAGACVVGFLVLGGMSSGDIPYAALLGGTGAAALVYLLAWRRGLQAQRFVLIGVGISLALVSVTNMLLTKADVVLAQQAKVWMSGSLNGRGWDYAQPLALTLLVLLPFLAWAGRAQRTAGFDDDTATSLGIRLGRTRLGLAVLGIVLASAATAAAGPVEFVALMAPQVARRLARTPQIPLVSSALVGALIVCVADIGARLLFSPTELPVGVVTAAIGGPYLLWLLTRSRTGGAA
jgi:iron complex transport system permease protein